MVRAISHRDQGLCRLRKFQNRWYTGGSFLSFHLLRYRMLVERVASGRLASVR
jgi:hypothetical protein